MRTLISLPRCDDPGDCMLGMRFMVLRRRAQRTARSALGGMATNAEKRLDIDHRGTGSFGGTSCR